MYVHTYVRIYFTVEKSLMFCIHRLLCLRRFSLLTCIYPWWNRLSMSCVYMEGSSFFTGSNFCVILSSAAWYLTQTLSGRTMHNRCCLLYMWMFILKLFHVVYFLKLSNQVYIICTEHCHCLSLISVHAMVFPSMVLLTGRPSHNHCGYCSNINTFFPFIVLLSPCCIVCPSTNTTLE